MGLDAQEMEDEKNSKLKIAAAIFMIAVFMLGCGRKEAPKPKEPEKPQAAQAGAAEDEVKHKVMSFDLEGLSDSGAKKWGVKGESAEAVTQNQIKLNNIVASSYGEESEATITADEGMYDKSKNNVRLEKNVKATIENMGQGADDFINISGAADNTAKPKSAEGPKAKKKTKTIITCDGEVQFDYEKNQAYFNKNVKVVNDEGFIDADRITVNLESATKKIRDIVAEGNVKIQRGENTTFSDKATYIEAEKRIVLTGQPKLVIYQEGSLEQNLLGSPIIPGKKTN